MWLERAIYTGTVRHTRKCVQKGDMENANY